MSQEIFNNVIETVINLPDEAQNEIIRRIIDSVRAQREKKIANLLHEADVAREINGQLSRFLSGEDTVRTPTKDTYPNHSINIGKY